MYGPEYLDWKSECAAAKAIDAFLAAMEPEDRKWVLAVLRKRFEVRVEYRDNGLDVLRNMAQQNLRQQHIANPGMGGVAGHIASGLGL